jgi:putative hydrolase of the HAD superfamily
MPVRAVSFDVWNTLLKFNEFLNAIAHEIGALINKDQSYVFNSLMNSYLKAKDLRRRNVLKNDIVAESQRLACKTLAIDIEIFRKGIARAVMSANADRLLFEDTRYVLRSVKERGFKVAILGNVLFWPGSYTRILIERANISKFIDIQIYADEVGYQKPQREIFYRLLDELEVKPHEVIHIGDGLYEDFTGAVSAGLHAILLNQGVNEIVNVDSNAYIVPTLSSVLEILDRST